MAIKKGINTHGKKIKTNCSMDMHYPSCFIIYCNFYHSCIGLSGFRHPIPILSGSNHRTSYPLMDIYMVIRQGKRTAHYRFFRHPANGQRGKYERPPLRYQRRQMKTSVERPISFGHSTPNSFNSSAACALFSKCIT